MAKEIRTIGIVTYTREGNGPWIRTVDEDAKAELASKLNKEN